MALLAVFLLMLAVAALVTAPLRRGRPAEVDRRKQARREELEAAKEAKYRELRDAELDHRTGKLSDEDWTALDTQLRAEAVDILRSLDELQ